MFDVSILLSKMTELQTAYDELKSHSERKISDLHVQVSTTDPSAQIGKSRVSISSQ